MSDLNKCPKCRGYNLERKWCDVCDGKGIVPNDEVDTTAVIHHPKEQEPVEAKVYIVNGREQKERPICAVRGCGKFADSPWTTCQEHWR
jgi:RecJ-like exonuclease